jgi:hypothetical protein
MRRNIQGGAIGRLNACVLGIRRKACSILFLAGPIYNVAASLRILGWMTYFLRPRLVDFGYGLSLFFGSHLIGHYEPQFDCWRIYPPFRLFIDENSLSICCEKHSNTTTADPTLDPRQL